MTWGEDGVRYQADPKHRQLIMEHFGFKEGTRALKSNGDKEVLDKGEDAKDLSSKFKRLHNRFAPCTAPS